MAIALASLLLGLPFTAIALFALQEARRLWPHNASALIGLLTAAYGLGHIASPPLVAALRLGLAIYAVLARRSARRI